MPPIVAIGPEESPEISAGIEAKLPDRHASPLAVLLGPRRPALEDRDGFATHTNFDPHLVAELGWRPFLAEHLDLPRIQVRYRSHQGHRTWIRPGHPRGPDMYIAEMY